jgi:hypothetical protein
MAVDDPSLELPGPYCLGCGYLLVGLPTNRCPECGRVFDPKDPGTFRRGASRLELICSRRFRRGVLIVAGLIVLAILVEANLDLGRRSQVCSSCCAH